LGVDNESDEEEQVVFEDNPDSNDDNDTDESTAETTPII
jgi:hypothetical protein